MENVIRRAVLYCQRGMLTINDLPTTIRQAVQGNGYSQSQAHHESSTLPQEDRMSLGIPAGMGVRPRLPMTNPLPPPQMHRGSQAPSMPQPSYAGSYFGSQQPLETAHASGPLLQPSSHSLLPRTATATSASLEARVDVLERRIIEDALQRNNFRRKETAAELGISRVTLYNKMKKFGLL
jgi:DNA-binding NtrC family response regulator